MDERSGPPEGYLLIGRLGKAFGLQGELHFRPLGRAEAEALLELKSVYVSDFGPAAISKVRRHGDGLVIAFEAVKRRERARQLVNAHVFAPADALPEPEGLPYHEALLDLPVLVDGQAFGTVAELTGASGAELLIVARPDGGEVMIPLNAPYVQLGNDAVLVDDPPPGLVDDGSNR